MDNQLLVEPSLISFFFNESVYIIDEKEVIQDEEKETTIEKNIFNKDFLIYLNQIEFSEILEIFLVKILQAVNIRMNDVQIIDIKEFDLKLVKVSEVKNCIIFGETLDKSLIKYTFDASSNLKCMFADGLRQINEDVILKKQLWTALKLMFNK